jgi:hypothetical protein
VAAGPAVVVAEPVAAELVVAVAAAVVVAAVVVHADRQDAGAVVPYVAIAAAAAVDDAYAAAAVDALGYDLVVWEQMDLRPECFWWDPRMTKYDDTVVAVAVVAAGEWGLVDIVVGAMEQSSHEDDSAAWNGRASDVVVVDAVAAVRVQEELDGDMPALDDVVVAAVVAAVAAVVVVVVAAAREAEQSKIDCSSGESTTHCWEWWWPGVSVAVGKDS